MSHTTNDTPLEAPAVHGDNPRNYVVTIGRSFGSGGRVLGRMLAERLGIDYYDKELLLDAARRSNMDPRVFEKRDERFPNYISGTIGYTFGLSPSHWYNASNAVSDDSVYRAQSDYILDAASRSSCVIVGRSADYVLRNHPRLVRVFISADEDACARRIVERGDAPTHTAAKNLARKNNKLRANYYNFYTDKEWGAAASYDLCIDSSRLTPEQVVELVAQYVKMRVGDVG